MNRILGVAGARTSFRSTIAIMSTQESPTISLLVALETRLIYVRSGPCLATLFRMNNVLNTAGIGATAMLSSWVLGLPCQRVVYVKALTISRHLTQVPRLESFLQSARRRLGTVSQEVQAATGWGGRSISVAARLMIDTTVVMDPVLLNLPIRGKLQLPQ